VCIRVCIRMEPVALAYNLCLILFGLQAYAALLKEMSAAHIIIATVRRLLSAASGGGGVPDLQRQTSAGDTMFRQIGGP
jgi:hypothetical protein